MHNLNVYQVSFPQLAKELTEVNLKHPTLNSGFLGTLAGFTLENFFLPSHTILGNKSTGKIGEY